MSNKMWFVICLLMILVGLCYAQIPRLISFQGYLTDSEEDPVADGTYAITFRIFNVETGGATLWYETQNVEVTNGLYSVYLGALTSLDLPFDAPYWLEVEFDGTTLSPRYKMGSSPYALNAANAATASSAEEVAWSDITGTPSDISDGDDYLYGETASGDLSGTFPNPDVAKLQGVNLATSVPTSGQVLKFDGFNWGPGTDLTGGASGTLDDLTDVSASTPSVGEVIKWNGSVWANAPDDAGGGSVGSLSEVLGVGNSAGINDINMNNNALLNIDWASSDDGAGSNLDADYFDGMDGSYYLDWDNFTDIPVDLVDGDDYMDGEAAGGDLDGTYPDPTVEALQGVAVSTTTPTSGQVLKYDGANWAPATDETGGGGGIGGGGSQNYVAKFTNPAGDQIGDSHIMDNGTVDISTTVEIEYDGQVGLTYDGNDGSWASIYVNAVNPTANPGYGYLRGSTLYGYTYLNSARTWILKTDGMGGYTERLVVDSTGNVGIGTVNPMFRLEVAGTLSTDGFFMAEDASAGYVLTSDGFGYGTWQPGGGGGDDGDWIIDVGNMSSAVSGNVGIGTTTPSHKLTVESESDSLTLRLIGPGGFYGVGAKLNFGDGDLAYIQEDYDDNLLISAFGRISLMSFNVGVGTLNPQDNLHVADHIRVGEDLDYPDLYGELKHDGGGTGFIINANAGGGWADMHLQTDGITKLFIESAGNVGIGTVTPTAKLDISLNSSTPSPHLALHENDNDYARVNFYNTETTDYFAIAGKPATSSSDAELNIYYSDFGDIISFGGNGKVGIGTIAPDANLTVQSSSIPEIQLKKTGGTNKTSKLKFYKDGDELFALGYDLWGTGTDIFTMYDVATGGAGVLNIIGGNIGIGTSSPGARLGLRYSGGGGDPGIFVSSSNSSSIDIGCTGTTGETWRLEAAADGTFKIWKTVGSFAMGITNTMRVGIGTSTPTRKLWVNGDAGGSGAWHNDSDARLKKNITSIPNALERITQLRGVEFEWKDVENHAEGKQIGFIAQEVLPVLPEVVDKPGEYYGMQYAPITALLVEAMKEQQEEIEQLKAENEALEARLKVVEEVLNDLVIKAN